MSITRKIGTDDVVPIGFGGMGLSIFYGTPKPDEERNKVLDAAYEQGCTFWDTSDIYGDNEDLIGKWLARTGKRNEIFLATKFGFVRGNDPAASPVIRGTPEYVREAIDSSLKRLGVDQIDLWYFHRPDSTVPIEVTWTAMAEAVKAGKVKYLGISECSEDTLRRAHAIHPIAAAQFEYAPFTLDIEDPKIGIFNACKELGIAIVAYSPLGRGLLTGKIRDPEDFPEGDLRGSGLFPKFSKENFPNILKVVDTMAEIGKRHNATAGQVALAWILAQGDNIFPIPGTTNVDRLKENFAALKVKLSPEELKEVRDVIDKAGIAKVPRVTEALSFMHYIDTPPLPK